MAGETHHPIDLLTSWTEALLAEREDDRKRLSKVLSGSSLKVRRAEGLTWSPVEVVEASYAFGGAKWSLACKEGGGLPGIFRVGSAVLLTPIGDPKDVAELMELQFQYHSITYDGCFVDRIDNSRPSYP